MAKTPPKILTLDTETAGLDGELRRIAIYDGEKVCYGYSFSDVSWVVEKWYKAGYRPYIYIHNADFDLRKIPEIWKLGNVTWARTLKLGNRYGRVTCKYYTIQDSFKLLPFSLAKLSKDFDLKHGKLDLWEELEKRSPGLYKDKEDFFKNVPVDDTLYLEYLAYDVISLYELIQKLMDVSGLGLNIVKCVSTASMSKYVLKNGYKGKVFGDGEKTDYDYLTSCYAWSSESTFGNPEISYRECEQKIRLGFYGGRTEVFKPLLEGSLNNDGSRKIVGFHYDVNSLYPSQMIDNDFPIGFPSYETDKTIIGVAWKEWCLYHKGLGFIRAKVFIPKQAVPPLPAKIGKLAFVTGHIEGTWTYNELEYAVKKCGVVITEFIEQIHFEKTYKVFKNFVTLFYKLKSEGKKSGNSSLTAFAKLMLNTAYGYTALRRDKSAFRDIKDLPKYENTKKFLAKSEELGFVEILDNVIAESVQVQVGAYVTSYARLVLLDALRAQAENGEIYYCDTDSIVCSDQMPETMVDSYEIGKWDLEAELYSGVFLQPKVYTEEKAGEADTIKFKGVSRTVQAELNREVYKELLDKISNGSTERYLIEQGRQFLPSLSVAQKRGENPNKLKTMDKTIDLGAVGKRDFNYLENISEAWHMENLDAFHNFKFQKFDNPADGKNLFGG